MVDMLDLLRELSLLDGVSGEEGRVREYILGKIGDHCTYTVDALGNILAFKKGETTPKNRVQFSAHMDEVGFIITYIEEDGLLRFAPVGGIDARVTAGKGVHFAKDGRYGVIGLKPVHLLKQEEKDDIPKLDDLLIDIGAKDRAEAEKYVEPGDRVVFDSAFVRFGHGMLKGKALDDRAGCALLIEFLCGPTPKYDCWCTFTVQEENGCVGGATAAYTVRPDIAVALETTTAGDIADAPAHKTVCRLGAGPVFSFMDRGTLYDMQLYTLAMQAAREAGIPAQAKEGVYGGNESRSLQKARGGARVAAMSLPCRYLHSPSCVLQESDLRAMSRLLPLLAERFAQL